MRRTFCYVAKPTVEKIEGFVLLVGRENRAAGTGSDFSSHVAYSPKIDPAVLWAKFEALAEGVRLARPQPWA